MRRVPGREDFVPLAELVALDTVSPMQEYQLLDVQRTLAAYGCGRVDDTLFARGDPSCELWLYAHVDTKPPEPLEGWSSDPFTLVERGGRWYGLGVSDAKFQLLNALRAAPDRPHFLLVDGAEECQGGDAARFLTAHDVDTMVVLDGAIGRRKVYSGLSGQVDGTITLCTGRTPAHPGREHEPGGDVLSLVENLAASVRGCGVRFVVTGIAGPVTVRSLSLEEVRVRFDLRFSLADDAMVRRFVEEWRCDVRQWLAPAEGREAFEWLGSADIAPFSSGIGGPGAIARRVVVIPGATNENGRHTPDEHIFPHQLDVQAECLEEVIQCI